MIPVDFRDARPIYEQVRDGFRQLILSGVLPADSRLPSVRELASELAINPNTIQRAYRELEAEGCVYTAQAKGTFAASPASLRETKKAALMQTLRETAAALRALGVSEEELHRGLEESERD